MPSKASQIELSQQALELKHRNASKKPVVPTESSAPAAALSKGVAVLRRHQVLQKLGIANTTLYDWIMRGLIPPPLDIGPGTQSSCGWRATLTKFYFVSHANAMSAWRR
jgi:predicted DNA-binding transcriptional regulator AlpA